MFIPFTFKRPVASLKALFVFKAEDGIRYPLVTGVQTCALPICESGLLGDSLETGGAHLARRADAELEDRKSVVEGKSVDRGGRRIIEKKKRGEMGWQRHLAGIRRCRAILRLSSRTL